MKNVPRNQNLQQSLLDFVMNCVSNAISEAMNFDNRDSGREIRPFQLGMY